MVRGVINIVLGLLLAGAGLSGRFVFLGTSQSWPLVLVGGILAALGAYRLVAALNQK